MPNGTVKFFNAAKGFGFITSDEGGGDVFVPASSAPATHILELKPGQRISFEVEPDKKGPKAVNLKLLTNPHPPKVAREPERHANQDLETARNSQLTFYHDPEFEKADEILAEFHAAGCAPRIVDYIATPPTRDELKWLSLLLQGSGEDLVKRYEPLFHELNLDDRFISENEYWDAIVEHPKLIRGPIAATASKAGVCRSESSVKSFLAATSSSDLRKMPTNKGISARILRLLSGDVEPSPKEREEEDKKAKMPSVEPMKKDAGSTVAKDAGVKTRTVIKPVTKAEVKKAEAKKQVTPKAKEAIKPKAKKPAKKAVPKVAKKAGRTR